jgi:hypothetical protein
MEWNLKLCLLRGESFSELQNLAHNDPLIEHQVVTSVRKKPDGPNEAGERLRMLSILL